ncbi:hypothetical protein J3R83DRAFT_441 [Lanmaoa asiatica]|nr:hypothetical protein J3R83DRAFT_441 [Lanmaoa asiatica]
MRIISALSLVVCVSAASLQPLLAHRVPAVSAASFGQPFERRQVSVGTQSPVPSQCASTCNPVFAPRVGVTIPSLPAGCPVTACCTTTFETQYYNCLECVGMALNASNYATAQNDLNLLYTTCVDMGFVLPQLALPGQPASGSSSSAGAHAASTGSVVPSASATVPFPTTSNVAPSSSSSTTATGAAISGRWRGVQTEALIGAAVLLGVVGLW